MNGGCSVSFAAARRRISAKSAISSSAGGRSSGRESFSSCGIDRKRSSSDLAPTAASISRTSSGV
jgi:hypothetical protein